MTLLLAAVFLLSSCANQSTSPSSSPLPTKSVTALPGRSVADIKADPAAYQRMDTGRIVQVFIKTGTPAAKIDAMAGRIAAMPEVVAYHYFDEKEALARFTAMFGKDAVAGMQLPPHATPAFFEILVGTRAESAVVARRFFHDSIVDSDPGTHNGVLYPRLASPTASPQ